MSFQNGVHFGQLTFNLTAIWDILHRFTICVLFFSVDFMSISAYLFFSVSLHVYICVVWRGGSMTGGSRVQLLQWTLESLHNSCFRSTQPAVIPSRVRKNQKQLCAVAATDMFSWFTFPKPQNWQHKLVPGWGRLDLNPIGSTEPKGGCCICVNFVQGLHKTLSALFAVMLKMSNQVLMMIHVSLDSCCRSTKH